MNFFCLLLRKEIRNIFFCCCICCKLFLIIIYVFCLVFGIYFDVCTMRTSETELILRTYIVTPTSTGGPATYTHTRIDGIFILRLVLVLVWLLLQSLFVYLVFCFCECVSKTQNIYIYICVGERKHTHSGTWNNGRSTEYAVRRTFC